VRHSKLLIVLLATSVAAAAGCSIATREAKRAQAAAKAGNWDEAVAHLTRAVQEDPSRADLRIELERAMLQASYAHLERARALDADGQYESAIVEYRRVTQYDPSNRPAMMRAAELERIVRDRLEAERPRPAIEELRSRARREGQEPLLNPASREPLTLRFTNASTQDILNFIGSATGINVMYERDFKPATFSIQLDGVTLEQALNHIMAANQLWYKVVDERTILVIPDTTQKRQAYEEQVIRTFYISHADPQELVQMLTQVARPPGMPVQPVIAANKTANTITVRATKGVADVIERIIQANDKPRAEILVDVEILEVNRTRAKEFGINLTDYQVGAIFSPEVPPSDKTAPFNLNTVTRGISTADFFMTVPSAVARFLATDSSTRLISKPQLRGMEGQKLTLNLGDEVPVPSTTFTPVATGGPTVNPLVSFTYRSVGVNLEITPRVTYEGEIVLDLFVESSNIGDSIQVAGQSLPTFGSRKATTRLRLREGESNLLAGLLREEQFRRLRGFPGIMNLPFFRQLFTRNDQSRGDTDIIILITPRIVRTHELTQQNLSPIFIGTQQNFGLTDAPRLIQPPAAEAAGGAAAPAGTPPPAGPGGAPGPASPMPPAAPPGEAAAPQPVPPPATGPAAAPGQPQPPAAPTGPGQPAAPPATTPAGPTPPTPAPTPAELAESPAPAPAQIVITVPAPELRVGGGPYTVPISVTGASRLSMVSLSVTYDPAILRVRTVQEGSFLRQGGMAVTFAQQVDASAGRLDITMTRTNDTVGASGSGLLAAVLFEAVAAGSVTLTPSGVATNPQGGPMPLVFTPVTVTVK
jgi:type II secretory pathway component GspD/PulD (secretin)